LAEKELLQEPLEVRKLIEPEITRLAALRATAKNIKEMDRILILQEAKARDNLPITEEDTLFHEQITKSTGNSILIQLVQSLHDHLKASRHQSLIVPVETNVPSAVIKEFSPRSPPRIHKPHIKAWWIISVMERLISQSLKEAKKAVSRLHN
jgi:DNA-binding FadR family transcriptional regulator